MNEYIEKCFPLLTSSIVDENRKMMIKEFIATYDDSYREKLCKITDETLTEKEIVELYNKALTDGSLETDGSIAYAFALNKNLPSCIINQIVYDKTADTSFYEPLLNNHKDKMNIDVVEKVYDETPHTVLAHISHLKYLTHPITKEDLPFSEETMQMLALKQFDKDDGKRYVASDNLIIYRYITDESFIDDVVFKIQQSDSAKDTIATEMLNNYFISEEKRNTLFNILDYNPKKITNPTPYMVEQIYESTTETIFGLGMDRYSPKTKEESDAYHNSVFLLGDLVRMKKLTAGMELNLMQMLVDRKDRTSEHLTGDLARYTNDPRVLHLALQLKSTSDKDAAIDNHHLAPEDIIEVAKVSKKKIDSDLKKGYCVSNKHISRLISFSKRTTLPDDIYDTMFKVKDSGIGIEITKSEYTPKHILELSLKQSLDTNIYTRILQETQARLMLFGLDNDLPAKKTIELLNLIERSYKNISYGRPISRDTFFMRQAFEKDNPYIEKYKEALSIISSQISNEDCQKAVLNTIKILNEPSISSNEPHEIDVAQFNDRKLQEKMKHIAYKFASKSLSTPRKTILYLEMEDSAKEFLKLKKELDRREALNEIEEIKNER